MTFTTMTYASAVAEEHRQRKSRRRFWIGVLLALAFIAAVACGTPAPESTPVQPNPPAAADNDDVSAVEPEKPAGVGDGQHAVGVDIKPGEYVTTVPASGLGCYWARVKDFSGELNSIIANGNLEVGARGRKLHRDVLPTRLQEDVVQTAERPEAV